MRKSSPTAALTGRVSGRMEWAAQPASSARARSPRNHLRLSVLAGSSAGAPKPASSSGWRGRCAGPRISADQRIRMVEERADEPLVCRGVLSHGSRGHLQGFAQDDGCLAFERMGDGRARLDPGQPMFSEREVEQGTATGSRADARPSRRRGGIPGSVSSAVRVPPPIESAASSTSTAAPLRASSTAAARPLGPLPMTTASRRAGKANRYAAGVAATTSPLASTIPSSQTASTRPPWNCCS